MSDIANKRDLAAAVHALVHTNSPDIDQMQSVSNALAQVFSDILGIDVTLIMRVDRAQLAQAMNKEPA
jgi:hypothetical protein